MEILIGFDVSLSSIEILPFRNTAKFGQYQYRSFFHNFSSFWLKINTAIRFGFIKLSYNNCYHFKVKIKANFDTVNFSFSLLTTKREIEREAKKT